MHKQLILLLAAVLTSYVPTAAQEPTPSTVPLRNWIAPTTTKIRAPRASSTAAPTPQFEKFGSRGHFQFPTARVGAGIHVSEIRESPPPARFWGGPLRNDGTLHAQNLQLGPLPTGGLQDFVPPRLTYPGDPRSVGPYGVRLSYDFGRDGRVGGRMHLWRGLLRVVGAARN